MNLKNFYQLFLSMMIRIDVIVDVLLMFNKFAPKLSR